MSNTLKELRVGPNESAKKIMYIAKEFLLNHDVIEITAGTNTAGVAARAAEALVRLNYITYQDVRTETLIVNDRRRTRVVIKVKKTPQFKDLYDENEANRKKKEEEANAQAQKK